MPENVTVRRHRTFGELDKGRVRAAIETYLPLSHDFFEKTHPIQIFTLEGNGKSYGGVAIVTQPPELGGVLYLSKFFINPELQGNGHSVLLLRDILRHNLEWYESRPDGRAIGLTLRTHSNNPALNYWDHILVAEGLPYRFLSEMFRDEPGIKVPAGLTQRARQGDWVVYGIGLTEEEFDKAVPIVASFPDDFRRRVRQPQ